MQTKTLDAKQMKQVQGGLIPLFIAGWFGTNLAGMAGMAGNQTGYDCC